MTERDRYVLVESARVIAWFGLLSWMLHYSVWLGAAFGVYVALYHKIGLSRPNP